MLHQKVVNSRVSSIQVRADFFEKPRLSVINRFHSENVEGTEQGDEPSFKTSLISRKPLILKHLSP